MPHVTTRLRFLACLLAVTGSLLSAAPARPDAPADEDFWERLLNFPLGSAQELEKTLEEHIFNLGEVLVPGARLGSRLADAPATELPRNVTLIGARELRERRGEDLPRLLGAKEGVTLTDEIGAGRGARVDLRGFGGEGKQALVLFDGLRAVEPFDNSTVWHLYPAEFLDAVEIRRGGGSTVYGEGALSGTVLLRTKRPTREPHAAFEAAWGGFGTERTFAEGSGGFEKGGVYAGARYLDADGYRVNGGHEAATFLAKGEFRPTDRVAFDDAFYFADHMTGIPGPLLPAEAEADRRRQDPDGRPGDRFTDKLAQNALRATLLYEELGLELVNLFGWRFRVQDSVQSFGGFFGGTSVNEIETETFSDVLQGTWSLEGESFESDLTAGVEASKDDIYNPFTFTSDLFGPFGAERAVDRRMVGFFARHRAAWRKRLFFETGLRWDDIDWDIYDLKMPHLEKHKEADHVSPAAGVEWRFDDALAAYGSVSESFKAPDSNTLIFETPNLFTPNPDIDPQIARHHELGLRYAHPTYGSARVALFYVETKREILFNDISNLNENFDTRRSGLELAAEIAPAEGVQLYGNATFVRAEFDNGAFGGKRVPLVPETRWTAGALVGPVSGWSFAVEVTAVQDQYALNDFTNIFPVEDYATCGMRLAYRSGPWEIYVRGENIFGEEYGSFATSNGLDVLNVNPAPAEYVEAGFRIEI